MKLALLCFGGAALLLLLLWWCMRQLHFRIGSRHLKVMLFGMAIRRIELTDIAYVSKREPKGPAERWYSYVKNVPSFTGDRAKNWASQIFLYHAAESIRISLGFKKRGPKSGSHC